MARLALEQTFPQLNHTNWQLRSALDLGYNCFAWAGGDSTHRWEPTPDWFWPKDQPREYSLPCFVDGFGAIGYEPCNSPAYELGFQKVAIYSKLYWNIQEFPTHMARQDTFGRGWLSKIGDLEDIIHTTLEDLNGNVYGAPSIILKRSWLRALLSRHTFHCAWVTFKYWRFRRTHPHGI